MLHESVGAAGPGKFGAPDAQADEDEEPAGARCDEHNEPGDEAEGAHTDHEGLVEVAQDRMRVHALLAGFEPTVKAAGFAFFDFVFEGFQGWSFQTGREFRRAAGWLENIICRWAGAVKSFLNL